MFHDGNLMTCGPSSTLFHAAIPFVPPTGLTDPAYDRPRNITSKVKFIPQFYE